MNQLHIRISFDASRDDVVSAPLSIRPIIVSFCWEFKLTVRIYYLYIITTLCNLKKYILLII